MSKKIKPKREKSHALSWAIFLITIEILLISLVTVVFPALMARTVSPVSVSNVESFEVGVYAVPLFLSNLIIFAIVVLYLKNKLPIPVKKSIEFIFNFEVSKKIALISIVAILAIYVSVTVNELAEEEAFGDYSRVKQRISTWNISQIGQLSEPHFRYFLLSNSISLFDNIRVIPFVASIALLILTYFITYEITKKRFASIVSLVILLQSSVFLKYDTTATYENFWTVLYLFSLYSIYKFSPVSPISFILSIFSKPMTVLFLPMTFFVIFRSKITKRKKIIALVPYLIILVGGVVAVSILGINLVGSSAGEITFVDRFFWNGFSSMAFQLRFDSLVVFSLLPVIVGLFIYSLRGIVEAEMVMVLIAGVLFSAPLLTGFTDITNQPYRFIPLVVFFAMGVGVLLSNKKTNLELRSDKNPIDD
ncbi:MAG: hypothetical protein ACRENO_03310 [Thermodesulfobacteriota bacterium]